MKEHEDAIQQVGQAFQKLGSSEEQAKVMAMQLVKRAIQLEKQNKSSFLEELGKLLQTVSCGAQGELKPEDKPNFS
jgi:hypothetical protein